MLHLGGHLLSWWWGVRLILMSWLTSLLLTMKLLNVRGVGTCKSVSGGSTWGSRHRELTRRIYHHSWLYSRRCHLYHIRIRRWLFLYRLFPSVPLCICFGHGSGLSAWCRGGSNHVGRVCIGCYQCTVVLERRRMSCLTNNWRKRTHRVVPNTLSILWRVHLRIHTVWPR
ncbi:hypothetical protein F5H01DRAFT_337720 [Linnemannia elongata]|nr:hypothetical protein F5H01DRAFT_337720 [Linnemannia elongata]